VLKELIYLSFNVFQLMLILTTAIIVLRAAVKEHFLAPCCPVHLYFVDVFYVHFL